VSRVGRIAPAVVHCSAPRAGRGPIKTAMTTTIAVGPRNGLVQNAGRGTTAKGTEHSRQAVRLLPRRSASFSGGCVPCAEGAVSSVVEMSSIPLVTAQRPPGRVRSGGEFSLHLRDLPVQQFNDLAYLPSNFRCIPTFHGEFLPPGHVEPAYPASECDRVADSKLGINSPAMVFDTL
jgi:hypothetical protein